MSSNFLPQVLPAKFGREILKYLEHYMEISLSQSVTRTINTSIGHLGLQKRSLILPSPPSHLIYIPTKIEEYIFKHLWLTEKPSS